MSDKGKDPVPTFKKAFYLPRDIKIRNFISTREAYNYIQAE